MSAAMKVDDYRLEGPPVTLTNNSESSISVLAAHNQGYFAVTADGDIIRVDATGTPVPVDADGNPLPPGTSGSRGWGCTVSQSADVGTSSPIAPIALLGLSAAFALSRRRRRS